MTPRVASGFASPLDPRKQRARLGGFNLLPYRARAARRLRRRVFGEIAAAVCIGMAGVALWCAGRVIERAHFDAQRVSMERRLAAWAPQLKEAQRLAGLRDAERDRIARAAERAVSRTRTVDLFEALQRLNYDSVRLTSIRSDGHDARLEANAFEHAAAVRWLHELERAQRGWTTEVAGLQAARDAQAGGGLHAGRSLAFSVRIRWPLPPGARVGGAVASVQHDRREGA
ncbi:fimbrial protein [Burkholderia singularis]|uniref:Type IV pilus biogenesis protein PilN n=1 Tax=Burkholderia singularis TaxID=1503053 RepID=A0A238H0B4_9BURK|nr:Type IV pilus biogenesis protein PilN [Burkholderia singularis]